MAPITVLAPTSTQITFQENVFSEQLVQEHAKRDIALLLQQAQARLPNNPEPHRVIGTVKIDADATHLDKILGTYRNVATEENLRLREQSIPIHMEITNGGHGEIYLAIANYAPIEKQHLEFPLTFNLAGSRQEDYAKLVRSMGFAQEDEAQLLKIIPEIYSLAEKGKLNLANVTIGRAEDGSLKIEGITRRASKAGTSRASKAPKAADVPVNSQNVKIEQTSRDKPSYQMPIILSKTERANLLVPQDELAAMKPDELTDKQWAVISSRLDTVSRNNFNVGFDTLFPPQKIEIIRMVLSPHAETEGKVLGFVYEPGDGLKKAAETLSGMKGDCDDYSLLYISCIKRLENEGRIKVNGIRLAVADYYDPTKGKVLGHANVLQFSVRSKDANDPTVTGFLVDLTYTTSSIDLKISPETAQTKPEVLKDGFVDHLNGDKKTINKQLVEFRTYNTYAGAELYYHDMRGASLMEAKKDQEALESLSTAIDIGRNNDLYYGDALFRRAELRRRIAFGFSEKWNELFEAGKGEGNEDLARMAGQTYAASQQDYQEAVSLKNLSAFAYYRAEKYFLEHEDYPSAQSMALNAIRQAPFDSTYYAELWGILEKQGRYSEAAKIFQEYRAGLDSLDTGKEGTIFRLKGDLDNYVKSAETELGK